MQKQPEPQISSQINEKKTLNQMQIQKKRQQGLIRRKQLEQKAKQLGVSVSHLKKQLRKQKWQEQKIQHRKQKRLEEKQRKKQKKALIQKELEKKLITQKQIIGERQIQLEVLERQENVPKQQKIMKKRRQDYVQKMKDGLKVVIDLQFYDLMTQKQLNSLVKQLSYCHSSNRRVSKPFNYILTSTTEERQNFIDQKYNGKKWGVSLIRQPVHQAFSIERLVYLTGDATQDISQFDEDKIYIIGGIVDHNRLKKITYNYSIEHKIQMRKLPLKDIKLKTNVHLAVNHVWEWMLKKYNGQGWDQALSGVLPERKIIKSESAQHSNLGIQQQQAKQSQSQKQQNQIKQQ